jgi:hypothetical protein
MRKVEFPETFGSIGSEAFQGCRALAHVIMPFELEAFGQNVFVGCNACTSMVVDPMLVHANPNAFPRVVAEAAGITRPRDVGRREPAAAGAGAGAGVAAQAAPDVAALLKSGAGAYNPFA